MKKKLKLKKALALVLTACMLFAVLAGCGDKQGGGSGSDAEKLTDLTYTGTVGMDIATLNIFNTANPGTFKNIINLYDPLLTYDSAGNLIPALAESWEPDEAGTTWTFHIREGASWVNYKGEKMADVVAEDWLWAMEWVLNYWKNGSYNTSEPIDTIVGAAEYYNYTQNLSEAEAKALDLTKFQEMVGVEAPDEHTLVYHLVERCPYFGSLVTGLAFYSVSGQLLEQIGVDGFLAMSNETAWYSGPYMLTEWIENNEKIFTKNPLYWDKESEIFDTITCLLVESTDVAYQMFENGEVDYITPSSAIINMIQSDPSNQYYNNIVQGPTTSVTWFTYFNYNKNNADGTPDVQWNTAVANEAFRKCLYYGVDYTNYLTYTNPVDPMGISNNTITAYNIARFSDGSDYTDHVLEKIGVDRVNETYPHMDADLLAQYKEQAIEELTAQGVTFPITIEMWASSSQSSIDSFTIAKECIEDSLGTDFVNVHVNSYITSRMDEVIYPSLHSIALDGYGATYLDPLTYLSQMVSDVDGAEAEMSGMYGNVSTCTSDEVVSLFAEFTRMVREANALDDEDARLEGFAEAEAFAIQHALIIPLSGARTTYLTRVNWYTKPTFTSDFQSGRWINVETSTEVYTQEQYQEAYNAYIGQK